MTLLFDGTTEKQNKSGTGTIATLVLECVEGAEIGEKEISLSEVTLFDALKPLGEGEDEVTDLTGTSINVLEMLYGDLLFDGKISISDLAVIRRYLAGWADSTDVGTWPEADINKDDDVNMDDVAILQRYLARWEGYEKFFQ
ncbi:MAG: dockerin type I repeat-containing protein [Lachnospiraceae bacterium]|nr:dockerin type I repeat-containing protein [Lachnospiraceae bacterium]